MKTITLLPHLHIRKIIIRHFLFFVSALVLTGCATGSTKVDLTKIDASPPEKATIFVIRPAHLTSAIRGLSVTANNTKVADLSNLSYTSFLMAPGKLQLSGDGSALAWPHREITIDVAGGQTYYIAWMFLENNSLLMVPVMNIDTLHWEALTKEGAQYLLNSTNYVAPIIREIP